MLYGGAAARQDSLVDRKISVPADEKARILREKDPKSLEKVKARENAKFDSEIGDQS